MVASDLAANCSVQAHRYRLVKEVSEMQKLIYYPSFEVRDEDWLKFALLYIDELRPIIPASGDEHLTARFRSLIDSTDLIRAYRPEYDEGCKASEEAIRVVTRLLAYPQLFLEVFGDPLIAERWRRPFSQKFLLFREKFAVDWLEFVKDEHLGHPTNRGIYMARELASIYMTILAQKISDRLNIPAITDDRDADALAVFTQRTSPADPDSVTIGRSILDVKIPENLSEIPLSRVIEFRSQPGFRDRLHGLHAELQRHITAVENGSARGDFLHTRGSVLRDMSDELASLGGRMIPITIAVWLLLRGTATGYPETLAPIAAATGATITTVISVRNYLQNNQDRRFTRKYLADLRALPGDYAPSPPQEHPAPGTAIRRGRAFRHS